MKRGSIFLIQLLIGASIYAQTNNLESPGENTEIAETPNATAFSIASYHDLLEKIELKAKKTKPLYFEEVQQEGSYGVEAKTITRRVKKHIYNAGQLLISHEEKGMTGVPKNDMAAYRRISETYDRLLYLGTQDNTKSLEKQLKKAGDVETTQSLFFGTEI